MLVVLDELHALCSLNNYNYDVICVVESWLSCDVFNSEISINGYDIFRLDQDRHGGGIPIFAKSEFCASIFAIHTVGLEFLPLTLKFHDLKFCIAVFYRPPSSVHKFRC